MLPCLNSHFNIALLEFSINVVCFVLVGGSSSKVVDCILCLKGYYEWKLSGGVGVWRYGGTVRITSFPKGTPPSLVDSESADESLDEFDSSQYEQLLKFLHLSGEVSVEETRTTNVFAFLFDHFVLKILQAYLRETDETEDLPLNAMVGKILSNVLYFSCFCSCLIVRKLCRLIYMISSWLYTKMIIHRSPSNKFLVYKHVK